MASGPHVSETGEVKLGLTRVKLAGVDPGLVAGRARDGGEVRVSSSGDQIDGGGRLRGAGACARRVVAVGDAGATTLAVGGVRARLKMVLWGTAG